MSQVKMRDQFGNHSKVVFDGSEDDARKHIVDNFPRLHVEPGNTSAPEPDAVLDHEGSIQHWDGVKWHGADDSDADSPAPVKSTPRKAV